MKGNKKKLDVVVSAQFRVTITKNTSLSNLFTQKPK